MIRRLVASGRTRSFCSQSGPSIEALVEKIRAPHGASNDALRREIVERAAELSPKHVAVLANLYAKSGQRLIVAAMAAEGARRSGEFEVRGLAMLCTDLTFSFSFPFFRFFQLVFVLERARRLQFHRLWLF